MDIEAVFNFHYYERCDKPSCCQTLEGILNASSVPWDKFLELEFVDQTSFFIDPSPSPQTILDILKSNSAFLKLGL